MQHARCAGAKKFHVDQIDCKDAVEHDNASADPLQRGDLSGGAVQHNGDEDHSECEVIISSVGSEMGESGSDSGTDSESHKGEARDQAGDGCCP